MKVLVCDDNKSFTGIVSNYLASQNDMEVVDVAVNGKEAVDKIIKTQPDVVLLDLVMPELDGLGVIEKLIESKPEKMPKIVSQPQIYGSPDNDVHSQFVTMPLIPFNCLAGLPADDNEGVKLEQFEQYSVPEF